MNKFRLSAVAVLSESNKPLHYKEITKIALEKGILETEGATPDASMNAQIILDIKHKGNLSDFIKTAPSTYGLNPNKPLVKIDKEDEVEEEKLEVSSGYIGKAGEHLVCSELLFRGFNASIMSVDTGLDIVQTKESRLYGIQVKTARLNKFKCYNFDIRKVSFERNNTGSIYYIFVLFSEKNSNYLILPYFEIEKLVHEKAILEVGHGLRYRVNIKIRDGKVYLGTLNNNMDYFLNNCSTLK
jgi:Holliday junction resolvase